jgi:Repeat of unknown function (DUF5650)
MNYHSIAKAWARGLARCLIVLTMLMSMLPMAGRARAAGMLTSPTVNASQIDIVGPPGSGAFGYSVTALPNGNIVVTDPLYSLSNPVPVAEVGAVYLYNGATGALISTLTGSTANDAIGIDGVTVLANGNYVVRSRLWHNGAAYSAGAITWGSATTGVSGVVSAANSLVGSTRGLLLGSGGVVALANGNYVVCSPFWQNGPSFSAGAVTWGNGVTGVSGVVSAANSLVGSVAGDLIGYNGVTALTNSNYVVRSPNWHSNAVTQPGAATWGNGATGITGIVSAANSLVGSTTSDRVGENVVALSNGNYVVYCMGWNGSRGAATWGNGATGTTGVVSAANSLVGGTTGDTVSGSGVVALTNGNYVVCSAAWDNGGIVDAGAATWGNGVTGTSGVISAANSLVGSNPGDEVGYFGTKALLNGNYVVISQNWNGSRGAATWGNGASGVSGLVGAANSLVGGTPGDGLFGLAVLPLTNGNYVVECLAWHNGAAMLAGAVTWGNGATGVSGVISAANSLVGSHTIDLVGFVTPLTNGNYVVGSPHWRKGVTHEVGAATWANGMTGISGLISETNSLVGSTQSDMVGWDVTALTNGNYVVSSGQWSNGAIYQAGAATWGNGATGTTGVVSAANSLIGSTPRDQVGAIGVLALTNGNYVVNSSYWNNGAITQAGAVTWGNGATGTTGVVSAANSLVGSMKDDVIGSGTIGLVIVTPGGVKALPNGNYYVNSPSWDNGASMQAGAISFGFGSNGATVGPVDASNSVLGTVPDAGSLLVVAYDSVNSQLVVGRRNSNIVTLFRFRAFDACLQDDGNPNTSVAFNTQSGAYVFCAGGAQYSGMGTITRRGSTISLQHMASDRRLTLTLDTAVNRATGSLQKLGVGIFSLTDRDTRNDTCPCAAP